LIYLSMVLVDMFKDFAATSLVTLYVLLITLIN
jgi:hypothetical protein